MKKSHEWITLENPRNGKIQVRVCTKCGSLKLPSGVVTECNERPVKSLSTAGWKQVEAAA